MNTLKINIIKPVNDSSSDKNQRQLEEAIGAAIQKYWLDTGKVVSEINIFAPQVKKGVLHFTVKPIIEPGKNFIPPAFYAAEKKLNKNLE